MDRILEELDRVFGPRRLGELAATALPDLAVALITLFVFWAAWWLLRRAMRAVWRRTRVDPTAASFAETVTRIVLVAIAVVTALGQLGIDTSSLLTSLGVAGLTLGFAARDALSNVISGIFIFWDRPFVLGDLVEIDGRYGRVETITMRSTRVVTPDGRMLAIPNTTVVNSTVTSYTNFPHLRLDVPVTVHPGEDLGRVRRILLGIVTAEAGFMIAPAPVVIVKTLNDYNVEVELRAWITDETEHIARHAALREAAFEALRAAGVDMPAETFRVEPVTVRSEAA